MAEDPPPVFVLACVSCGKTVSGNEIKCPRCGALFDDREFECPFCGEHTTSDDSRCKACSTEFEVFAEEVAETATVRLDGLDSQAKADEGPNLECPACGRTVGEAERKCPHCGAMFSE
ncbi:MAG: zinc ribbon domain-containing protein [Methanobacteriota archaeon]|nr:MAG: zinc ribbon domain-containing protein [Euryarchaeota archaeon]